MGRTRTRDEPSSYKKPVGRPKGLKVKKQKLKERIKKRYTFALNDHTVELLTDIAEKTGLSKSAVVDKAVAEYAERLKFE
ncbi:MAG: ribbon-helix-helix domain-containing protein [Dysgonamonadaceae bacterium]|nr:ribbon-helix-helix domain-containing protein [Dysgonamonadaceae bacterium]